MHTQLQAKDSIIIGLKNEVAALRRAHAAAGEEAAALRAQLSEAHVEEEINAAKARAGRGEGLCVWGNVGLGLSPAREPSSPPLDFFSSRAPCADCAAPPHRHRVPSLSQDGQEAAELAAAELASNTANVMALLSEQLTAEREARPPPAPTTAALRSLRLARRA